MGKAFANGAEDSDLIQRRIIPKTQKMVLDVYLLNTRLYKVEINGKWSNLGEGVAKSPTPRYSSYWNGNLQVALEFGLLTI